MANILHFPIPFPSRKKGKLEDDPLEFSVLYVCGGNTLHSQAKETKITGWIRDSNLKRKTPPQLFLCVHSQKKKKVAGEIYIGVGGGY
jgi:hypothetical protein